MVLSRELSRLAPALTVLTLALCAACGGAPAPQPEAVWSTYEIKTGQLIARDCGYSAPLAGPGRRSIWLFCDTALTSKRGTQIGLPILGTGTAAEGPYRPGRAPDQLTEVTTPLQAGPPTAASPAASAPPVSAGPRPFLPAPAGLTLPGSTLPCTGPGVYPARWISGVAAEPGGHLLISYDDYCVTGASGFAAEAFGLVDYDPAGNVLGVPAQVFTAAPGSTLSQAWVLGSPIFRGGYLYLFSFCAKAAACPARGVFLVRTPAVVTGWQDGYTYQYWTGRSWSASSFTSAPLTSGSVPVEAWAGDFAAVGHGLVMIVQTSLAGDFEVWQAAQPTGPWHQVLANRVPCARKRAAAPGDLCRALVGHPELSTRNDLLVSWFDPSANHIELAAYPW